MMEHGHALRARLSGQFASLARSQMTVSGRSASVLVQERGLDIQVVCVAPDCDDSFSICRMESSIGHIRDPLSGGHLQRMLT